MKKFLTAVLAGFVMLWSAVPTYAYVDGTNFELSGITPLRTYEAFYDVDTAISGVGASSLTHNYIFVGNGSNVPTGVAQTGDGSFSDAGVFAIAAGSIINADIKSDAAIAFSKLATSTDINTSGQVVDFTLTGEAQGEVPYFDGTNWASLNVGSAGQSLISAGAGANPYWGYSVVSSLANSVTAEAGANDYTLSFGTAGGAYTFTFPTITASDTFSTLGLAQTFTAAKTFPNTGVHILDSNASHDLLLIPGSDLTADRNFTITTGDAARTLSMAGNITVSNDFITSGDDSVTLTTSASTDVTLPTTGTLATLAGTESLSAKTLTAAKVVTTDGFFDGGGDEYLIFTEATTPVTYIGITSGDTTVAPRVQGTGETNTSLHLLGSGTGDVYVSDGTDPTKDLFFELNGATTAKTMQIVSSQTDDRALTLPDATDTLVGKATTDIFTGKSIDADGSGNVLTNVNGDELDPITIAASAQYGIEITIPYVLTNQAAAVNIFNANAPFKFRVIDAYSVATSADGGTWKLNNGAAGAGTDITDVVTVAASDKDIDRITEIDDAGYEVAESGSLSIVPDGGGALDCQIYIKVMRVD